MKTYTLCYLLYFLIFQMPTWLNCKLRMKGLDMRILYSSCASLEPKIAARWLQSTQKLPPKFCTGPWFIYRYIYISVFMQLALMFRTNTVANYCYSDNWLRSVILKDILWLSILLMSRGENNITNYRDID